MLAFLVPSMVSVPVSRIVTRNPTYRVARHFLTTRKLAWVVVPLLPLAMTL